MKGKRSGVIQLAILGLLGAAVLVTLTAPDLGLGGGAEEPLAVSVLVRDSDASLWANTRLGMEQAAGDLGAELRFLSPAQDSGGDDQEALLRREVERGADVLVLQAADPAGLEENWAELTGGLPVICLGTPLEGAAGLVAPEDRELGRLLGEAAGADYASGQALLLDTAPEDPAFLARLEGAEEALAARGIQTQRWSDTGLTLEQAVTWGNFDRLVALEPSATEAAARLRAQLDRGPALYGVGSTTAIAAWLDQGVISAVAAWSDYAAGYLAVEGAVSAARGETEGLSQTLPARLVRGSEMYEPDNQKLLFPVTS